ncbi:MAG: sigma-70 family RNA polymerase sigma factor [Verrucomicrobia bacterium]|nr:sigma-70 family RNA polymerase sigma factor [Verrucomicrobiota bacterium]
MNDDATLLRRYAEGKSEAAFAELVGRHLDLVYSAALRRLGGDAHRAADVAQQVFATLAREAARLSRHTVLTAWLYTATRNAATDVIRTEQRRRAREQEAHLMETLLSDSAPDPEWEKLRPVIDAAMDELAEADRTAVLLRYFKQWGFAEIGAALGLSENAARMRVDRALDRLRTQLARRGVTSAAAFATVLASQTVTAAPAGLAATIADAALPGASAAVTSTGFLTMTNLKIALVTATALAGLTTAWVEVRASRALETEISHLSAEHAALVNVRRENQRLAASSARVREVRAVAAAAPAPARAASEVKSAAQWRNAGVLTPEATYETQQWARVSGNLAGLATTYAFSGITEKRMTEVFARLSPEAKARFGTPAVLSAYQHSFAPWRPGAKPTEIASFRFTDQAGIGPLGAKSEGEGWVYVVAWDSAGRETRTTKRYLRTAAGWQSSPNDPEAQWQKIVAYFDPLTGEPKDVQQ